MKLVNKIALVTGGAQGIGLSIAETFCKEGAVVYLGDTQEEQGAKSAAELSEKGCSIHFILLNVSDENSWKNAVAGIVQESGRIDILVNNAGINIRKNIEDMSSEELDRMYDVNIKGPFLGTKYVLPFFRKQGGGSIINMSSVCGLVGHKYTPEAYTTTKGAVSLLTKSIASRYGKFNIRCNSIHPSTADTPLVREMLKDPERKKERIDEIPLGRMAGLNDISQAALYLASDEAGFINGIALPVDGGATAY